MRKLFKKIHIWLSLPFGLIITITCLSGALLVFEKELTELFYRERYTVREVDTTRLPLPVLIDKVASTLPDTVSITGVSIPIDVHRPYTIQLSKPRRAGVLIDPYTAEIKGRSDRSPFFSVVFRLHRWLLDSMKPGQDGIFWGRVIVGTSTLLFVIILLTGLLTWWPRKLKGLGKRFKISFRHGLHRLFFDLHTVGGVYALIFLLAISLTGLTWSFEWYRNGFYKVFGVEVKDAPHGKQGKAGKHEAKGRERHSHGSTGKDLPAHTMIAKAPTTYLLWDQVYLAVASRSTKYREISISEDKAQGTLNTLGNVFASDTYIFDKETGEIKEVELYQDLKKDKTIRGWIYSVHIGAWGGLTTRILAFLAALFGASLPLTGYYLFFKRKFKKRTKKELATT